MAEREQPPVQDRVSIEMTPVLEAGQAVNGASEDQSEDEVTGITPENGDPQAQEEPPKPARSSVETAILMATLCSAVFLAALDITIVVTPLPTISNHFHSTSGYTWIGSAFSLAAAVVAPTWGKFSDIWGRKSILLIANAIFFLGSALSGASISIKMLIIGRAVQGVGAGGLLTLSNILVGDLFSQRERARYYGIIGLVWAVASTLGPIIGGAFTNNVSWRWCFYINLPITGTAFFIILFLLKLETPKTPFLAGIKAIDWVGTVALVGGTLMFLLGLEYGGTTFPWNSATVICIIIFGIATVALFFTAERYIARYPLVPVHLFANTSNIALILVNLFHGTVFTMCIFFLPLYFQSALNESSMMSGVLILPFSVTMALGAVFAGPYIRSTGRFLDPIRAGFLFMILGTGLLFDLPDSKVWSKIIIYPLIAGFGVGMLFQPPLIALQSNVHAQDNASATASFALMRNVASAIGVVIGSVSFSNKMNSENHTLRAELGDKASFFTGAHAQADVFLINTFPAPQQSLVRKAYWASLRNIWIIAVSFSAVGFFLSLFVRNMKLKKVHEEVKTGLAVEEERRRIAMEKRALKRQAGEIVPETV